MSDQFCAFDTLSDDLYVAGFTKYLKTYHESDILSILSDEATEAHFAININVLDLLQASPRLGSLLLSYPTVAIPHFDTAALKAQEEIMKQDASALNEFKPNLHIRLHSLPLCQETSKTSVSSIRSSDINKFISVAGTVIKTGEIKMLEYQKTFLCTKCRKRLVVKADIEQHYTLQKPTVCTATEDCPGFKFEPVENTQVCRDYQEIKIQDKIAHLNVGSIPRSVIVVLEDDLVDVCKAGDDVVISGTVMRRWKPLRTDNRCSIEMIIRCNHVRINNEQKSNVHVTQELEQEFSSFWRRHSDNPLKARNLILKSMCPQLYGLYFVKLAVALTLVGGVPMKKNGTRIRGESHLLIVGDPGTGKSQFLKYASRLSPRFVMTNGIGTTSAGLTVMATKESGGDWTLEAGALVLADGGVCCIDEFDAIREHDRTTIHEAMEQQTLSIAKAGLVCKLNTRTTIFAACNPKGKYDVTASLSINCALASPLLSRFDVVLVLLDQKDDNWDKSVSRFILDENQVRGDEQDENLWNIEKMQSYISYVKSHFKPTMPRASGEILNRYYLLQRERDQRVAARTTIRLLESLVRLAQAHARLMFRNEVTEQDAIMAVITVDSSMHTSTLLKIDSVLHSNFPDDPDFDYQDQRRRVLRHLGLLADEPNSDGSNHRQTQAKQTLTQRFTQKRLNANDLVDDDDDDDDEYGNNDEYNHQKEQSAYNFAMSQPSKKPRLTQPKESSRVAARLSIPDFDDDDDNEEDSEQIGDRELRNKFSKSSHCDDDNSWRTSTSTQRGAPSQLQGNTSNNNNNKSNRRVTQPAPATQPKPFSQPTPTPLQPPTTTVNRATQQFETQPSKTDTSNNYVNMNTKSTNNNNNNASQKHHSIPSNNATKAKKRTIGHMLLDSQAVVAQEQEENAGDLEDDVNFLFGEMFDEPMDTVTPSVTKRSNKYY